MLDNSTRIPSLEQHWLKRTQIERQWPEQTTPDTYIRDLRTAILQATTVITYRFQGQEYAGFLAPNDFTAFAVGGRLPFVWVAYSAAFGVIRTGYKTEGLYRVFEHVQPEGSAPIIRDHSWSTPR